LGGQQVSLYAPDAFPASLATSHLRKCLFDLVGRLDGKVAQEEDMIVKPRGNCSLGVAAASRDPVRDILDGEVVGEIHRESWAVSTVRCLQSLIDGKLE
jgi:hypothetical protein